MKLPTDSVPFFSQFTREQIQRQYAKNAAGLRQMLNKAERTGKRINGYTADELRTKAEQFESHVHE